MRVRWPPSPKPRPGQLEVAEEMAAVLEVGETVALDAPTGWGKTLTTLVVLKSLDLLPSVWLTRSLAVGSRVAEDAALLGLRVFTAAGRERTCLAVAQRDDVHEYCRMLRYRCPYFASLGSVGEVEYVSSYEELVAMGKERGFCPYYAQEFVMCRADVVVQSYHRRRPCTRSTVVDEAHNIVLPKECSMPVHMLNDVIVELKRASAPEPVVRSLIRLKEYAEASEGAIDVSLYVGEDQLEEVRAVYRQALAAGVVTKLGRFLRIVTSDVVHVEGEPGGGMLVGINAPRIVLPPHSVLLSGTLLPDIKDVLGVGAVVTVPRPRLKVYVTPWLTSRYGEFEENIEGYVSLLKALRLRFRRVLGFGSGRIIRVLSKRLNALVEGEITRIPSSWDGILLLKSRGRFSEGVDIPADAVVMIGAPYLTPDVIQRLANVYRRLGYERYWEMAGDVPMLVTTLQCIGRATRVPGARPTVILADHRFLRHRESLSSYLEMEELGGLEQVKPG